MTYKEQLKKVNEVEYLLPKTGNMLVPGKIFASAKLMEKIEEGAIKQVANVACLPGIYKYSLAMPDLHSGYGFGIGGVAALDIKNGGISPGGIGYDINCTHPDAKILTKHGAWIKMEDLEKSWNKLNLRFSDLKNFKLNSTSINFFMKREEKEAMYEITSKTGHKIRVTGDHPILTTNGMKEAKYLNLNDDMVINSFQGIEYEEPSNEIILTKEQFEATLEDLGITDKGNAKKQVINFIEKLNILPLKYDSEQLPYLIKLIGFILGDGTISISTKQTSFYAGLEDLREIKKDIETLGFSTQKIFSRDRQHKINTNYGIKEFSFKETSLNKKSSALIALLIAVGCPYGNKTTKEYRVPKWILSAPLWQKRLFLATFFGAELSSPSTVNKYNFYELQLNMNKLETLKDNAIDFLNDLRLLLSEFEVASKAPVGVEGNSYKGKYGKTVGLRIQIAGNPKNLLNFFEKINYEYNKEKQKKACLAINYIKLKEKVTKEREEAREKSRELYNQNIPVSNIITELESEHATKQFIEHSIWSERKGARIAFNFMSFEEYCNKYAMGDEGLALSEIEEIKKTPYSGFVYDLNINNENHNFIADNIVISNCGVRLLSTNLKKEQIYPKIKDILKSLMRHVPAGLGGSNIRISKQELDKVLENGAKWAVENGYGSKEDLEFCEENGNMKGADAKFVSDTAKNRGFKQIATLGSGNHFLEIQYVDEIFDKEAAKAFGIEKEGQVTIMIHCGSRGLGHQVCSDYLREMEKEFPDIVEKLPDRELIYAPASHPLCKKYFSAMTAAANFAWCNRHIIGHQTRLALKETFPNAKLETVYDVAHNICKIEEHDIDGEMKKVYMHRKGATRAFGPGNQEIPKSYRKFGQPIIIPGSMGTASYLLVGTEKAEQVSFASTAHGAGREMSRHEALRNWTGEGIKSELEKKKIFILSASWKGIAEEAPGAYKDIEQVVDVSHRAGIGNKVCRLKPIGVIKG